MKNLWKPQLRIAPGRNAVRALMLTLILLSRKSPVSMLSWIWCICLFPWAGSIGYLLFGVDRLQRIRLKQLKRYRRKAFAPQAPNCQRGPEHGLLRLLSGVNGLPTSSAEEVRVLVDAREFYPALLDQIRAAKHHIHIMFFLWRDDAWGRAFRDELVAAASRGVCVRLLLDEVGCMWLRSRFFEKFVQAGGQFSWCHTVHPWRNRFFVNLRNHRKIQVFDGRCAFIGGMNMGREYAGGDPRRGKWRDVQLRVRGEVVQQLQNVFAQDWFFATGRKIAGRSYYKIGRGKPRRVAQLVAGGPDSHSKQVEKSLVGLLNFATERVWILPSYFVPNRVLVNALQLCAARGVDVRILVSRKSDHPYLWRISRSFYEELLRYGVRIFEFAAALSHSKVMLIDSQWLMVGSANLDHRSLELNFEANLLVRVPEEIKRLEEVLAADFADSREIRPCAAGFGQRLTDGACRLLAPLL